MKNSESARRILTDDVQIHVLQLTNPGITRKNLSAASLVKRWAFYLLNAEKILPDELRELFPEPDSVEAPVVVEAIAQASSIPCSTARVKQI